ncbi:hypothetical protein EQG49_01630 [Periweissella cryptocerci]|uniref:Peptidase C39-like domain-containing protein n=1 Tax=Periweissella cryptocerci TaxID=2506420 RepID=A0A4P6YRJ8_9LACO|nr:hypothetical protein [Periweissella cryptocerci]QBO35250.1 hypothetical protein EQG49_01630 [Periweissella cryptocerci]
MKKNHKLSALIATVVIAIGSLAPIVASAATTTPSTTAEPMAFSAQFLTGAKWNNNLKVDGKVYNFAIPKQAKRDSYVHDFSAVGCTENALANAMRLSGVIQTQQDAQNYAVALWQVQTGKGPRKNVSNNQQSLGYNGYTRAISMPKIKSVMKKANKNVDVLEGKESFTPVASKYFGYSKSAKKGKKVAKQLSAWRKKGYFIVIMTRATGNSDAANHATTLLSMKGTSKNTFKYGQAIHVVDSYQKQNGKFLTEGLSNKKKVAWTYKAVAYKAVDANGKMIKSNY